MNKYVAILIVVLVVLGGFWLINGNSKKENVVDDYVSEEDNTIPIPDTQVSPTNTEEANKPVVNNNNKKNMEASIKTNKGDITIQFFDQQAPKTVANFTKLAGSGFYDGVKFHRVIKGFMDQTGDPLSKDDSKVSMWGTGGPGYKFADEIDPNSDLYTKVGYQKGIVAMANSGPDTNGSQFFIMAEDYPLPPLYTIFAKVTAGQSVVDAINNVKTGPNDRPVEAVIINSITLK